MNKLALLSSIIAMGGCSSLSFNSDEPVQVTPIVRRPEPTIPTVAANHARKRISAAREFRLGVFDFGNGASNAGNLADVIPAMILTELRYGARFSLFEGGTIRLSGDPLNESNAKEHVDGVLSGTITMVSSHQACFDLRLANAVNYEVLYSRNVCVPVVEQRLSERSSMKRVAEDIERSIKRVAYGKVTSADGNVVFCDKGSNAGVLRGMVAYVVATGDVVQDPEIHRSVHAYTSATDTPTIGSAPGVIAEMYIIAAEPEYSVGIIHRGSYMVPGDSVFFK